MRLIIFLVTLLLGFSLNVAAQTLTNPPLEASGNPSKTQAEASDVKNCGDCKSPITSGMLTDAQMKMICSGKGKDIQDLEKKVTQEQLDELISKHCKPDPSGSDSTVKAKGGK